LGNWILHEACHQLKTWHETFPVLKDATVSVNLSSKQFSQPNLVDQIQSTLQSSGLASNFLRLELTETIIMENADSGISALKRLRNLGILVDVDDFGTGYSSLVYLHMLPLDAIKIDRSFISGSVAKTGGMRIVQSIVRLAQDLNLEIVAEGVEELEQVTQLRKMGCNYVQGFIMAKGLEKTSMDQFLANDMKRIAKTCQSIVIP